MRKRVHVAIAATAISLVSFVIPAGTSAASVAFPRLARGLSTWLVRAMDQCNPAIVSVVAPNVPSNGCVQSNAVTDDQLGMTFAKLRVSQRGRIALFGTGFTLGDVLRVRLRLRVTKNNLSTKHPPATNRVTFADDTVDCPKSPNAFAVRPNGAVAGSTDLGACLSPNSSLAQGNIEIIDSALVNVMNGKEVAKPGILR